MSVIETSKGTGDIVSIEQAFTWCRIDGYDESHPEYALVGSLIKAAEQDIEEYLNLVIRQRTFVYSFYDFCDFEIDKYPCVSIDSVQYHNGSIQDLPSENYESIPISNERFYLKFKGNLPVLLEDRYDAVKITVACGYELENVPEYIKTSIQLMVGEWYDNRGNGKREFPTVVEGILRKYRMMRI